MAAPSLMASSGTTETRLYRTDDWSSEQIGAFSAAVGFDRIGRRFAALDVDGGVQIWSVPTNGNSPLEIQVIPLERLHLKAFWQHPRSGGEGRRIAYSREPAMGRLASSRSISALWWRPDVWRASQRR